MSSVTIEFAPITERRPIRTPFRDDRVRAKPHVVLDHGGAFMRHPLVGDGDEMIFEPVVAIGDIASWANERENPISRRPCLSI